MPKMIDADKLLEWLDKQIDNAYSQDINAQDAYMITKWAAEEGKFDLTPPVQPDTEIDPYNLPISTTIKGRMTRTEYENIYGKPREVITDEQR